MKTIPYLNLSSLWKDTYQQYVPQLIILRYLGHVDLIVQRAQIINTQLPLPWNNKRRWVRITISVLLFSYPFTWLIIKKSARGTEGIGKEFFEKRHIGMLDQKEYW